MDAILGQQLLDSLQAGVILLDHSGRIIAWNAWMTRHSGFSLADLGGKRLNDIYPEMAQSRLADCIDQAIQSKLSAMLTPGLNPPFLALFQKNSDRKFDQRMQQLIYITPIRHGECACMLQIQDMTATVRRERRLRVQSTQLIATTYRDPLTNVGNRRRFDHDLDKFFGEALHNQTPLALIMIDIDHFKAYNDHFGHPQGDECLVKVAAALQDGLRQRGDRVSRYGGEEFAILLPATDRNTALSIAERLRARIVSLGLPHPGSSVEDCITISLGISAVVPTMNQPPYDLISQADLALYVAKDEGRNRSMCYDNTSNEVHAGA
jgi:diguanylate cyclase (GGDEF)-like protein